MALKHLMKGDGVNVPHIFVFRHGIGAHVASYLASFRPISGAVLSHTNAPITDASIEKEFQDDLKEYVVRYFMFLQSLNIS